MKECKHCGYQYPDDMQSCPFDQFPLEICASVKVIPSSLEQNVADKSGAQEDGYLLLAVFVDAFEAENLLKQFSEVGISFRIGRTERRVPSGITQYRTIGEIEIYILPQDYDKANQLYTADWRV